MTKNELIEFIREEAKADRDEVFRGYFQDVDTRVKEGRCLASAVFLYERLDGCYVYHIGADTGRCALNEGDLVVINQGKPYGEAIGDGLLMWLRELILDERVAVLEATTDPIHAREPPKNRSIGCTIDKGYSDFNSSRLIDSVRIAFEDRLDLRALLLGERQLDASSSGSSSETAESTFAADANSFKFTERQEKAYRRAFSHAITLIQGPPGTGKTRLLAEIIRRAITERKKVLVSAYTHAAIDNLLEATAKLQLPSDSLFKISGHASSKTLPKAIKQITFNPTLLETILQEPVVIGASVFQAYKMHLAGIADFDIVIIDEAGQVPIPHAMAAMICGDTYILAGDHKQLPPILKVYEPDDPVAISIFEHFNNCYPDLNIQLDVTYRMNKEINEFSSRQFYDGSLIPAPEAATRSFSPLPIDGKPDYLDDIIGRKESVTFVEVDHKLCWTISREEADLAAQLAIRLLLDHHLPPTELAIISPHRQHNREIRGQLKKLLGKGNGLAVKSILDKISIDTVEKMQGREREVVILSLCASKKSYLEYRASFLYKPNRLNVAITRCRTRLFVLASKQFFPCNNKVRINPRHAEIFNEYYHYLEQRKVIGTTITDDSDKQTE